MKTPAAITPRFVWDSGSTAHRGSSRQGRLAAGAGREGGWLALALLGLFGSACCRAAGAEEGVAGLDATNNRPPAESHLSDPTVSAAAGGQACGEISSCTDKCSAECPSGIQKLSCLLGCKSDCRAKGCDSAKEVFDELTDCIAKHCWTSCISGPTPACRTCSEEECGPEAKKCVAHRCPDAPSDGK